LSGETPSRSATARRRLALDHVQKHGGALLGGLGDEVFGCTPLGALRSAWLTDAVVDELDVPTRRTGTLEDAHR